MAPQPDVVLVAAAAIGNRNDLIELLLVLIHL
jgi:hypothetical protein